MDKEPLPHCNEHSKTPEREVSKDLRNLGTGKKISLDFLHGRATEDYLKASTPEPKTRVLTVTEELRIKKLRSNFNVNIPF